jgi:hypothetical protein
MRLGVAFAIATANLACEVAFLFLAAHCPMTPIYIASSFASSADFTECCLWNCNPPISPLAVKIVGMRFIPGHLDPESQTRKSPARRIGTPIPGSRPNRETARFPTRIPDSRPIGNRESGNPPPNRENARGIRFPIPDSRLTSEHQLQ